MSKIILLGREGLNSNLAYLFLKRWMGWLSRENLGIDVGVWDGQSVKVFSGRGPERDGAGQQIPRIAQLIPRLAQFYKYS